jgi:serine protease
MGSRSFTRVVSLALGVLAWGAGTVPTAAQEIEREPIPTPVPRLGQAQTTGEVLVKFRDGVDAARRAQILTATSARVAQATRGSDFAVLRPRPGSSTTDYLGALTQRWEVAVAEPNYLARAAGVGPGLAPSQWNLFERGVMSAQKPSNYGINAPSAWTLSLGTGVTVALLDTGCAYADHEEYRQAPDLAQARIRPGWDFVNNDGYPDDDNGHGTHVATTLVAPPNPRVGIAGVAPGCTIMPIKVLGADLDGTYANIAGGIRYAADQGAQIINLSLTGTEPSAILQDAVQYATAKGCLIVSAAGNESRYGVGYPARYPPCIAVGATRFDGQLAAYSNRGEGLTLVAPGGDTTVDQNGDGYPDGILAQTFDPRKGYDSFGYYFYAGTSMAAPQVSGVAALALSLNPRLGREGLRQALLASATHLGRRGWDPNFGYGLVNAAGAVQYAMPHVSGGSPATRLRSSGQGSTRRPWVSRQR